MEPKPQGINPLIVSDNQLFVDDSLNVYVAGGFVDTALFMMGSWGIAKIDAGGNVLWYAIEPGDGGGSKITSIALDTSCNVYASGNLSTIIGTVAVTQKYNAAGVLQWTRQLDTVGNMGTDCEGILVSADNHCYEHVRRSNITIRRYDALGNVTHQFSNDTINGWQNHAFIASEFKNDNVGNLYVAGTYVDTPNNLERKYFVKKFKPLGGLLWERFYNPTTGSDNPSDLYIDSLQNVYLTGYKNNKVACETVVYDSAGNEKWHQSFQLGGGGWPDEVVADKAGNCYVNGFASLTTAGGGTLIKYDTSGVLLWQRTIDSVAGGSFPVAKVVLDDAANIYVSYGARNNTVLPKCIVTAKYDSAGNLIWKVYYYPAIPATIVPKALALDKYNNVYITGEGFVVKYSQTASINNLPQPGKRACNKF